MAISHFHYLVTVFCLTVWSRSPLAILALAWFLQSLMFVSGIETPFPIDFFFWQTLTCFLGALAGITLVITTRSPGMMQMIPSVPIRSWTRWLIWIIIFVPSQLLFAFVPLPGGLLGTWGIHVASLCLVWILIRQHDNTGDPDETFQGYAGRRYFFLLWLLSLTVMEMLFFLNYVFAPASGEEHWTALIAAIAGTMTIVLVGFVAPLKNAWRDPPQPLMSTMAPSTENEL